MTSVRRREVEDWLAQWSPERRAEAQWLADRVHAAAEGVGEAVKWRRLTFTVHDDWHHWLCAVAVTARGADLVFHKGALLDDPTGALRGTGRYIRQLPYTRAAADPDTVTALVRQSVRRQSDMLDAEP